MRQQVGYAIRIEQTPEYRARMVAEAEAMGCESVAKVSYLYPGEAPDIDPPPDSARLGWLTPEDAQAALDFHIRKVDEFFGTSWRENRLFTVVKLTIIEEPVEET